MLVAIAKFLAAFWSYGKPVHIGFAMAVGVCLGIIPGGTLIWFLILIPMMLVRINQFAMLGTMGVVSLFSSGIDPLTERLGYHLLTQPAAEPFMTGIMELPGAAWFRLDDSLIFGSTVIGILGMPVYILAMTLVVAFFRKYLLSRVRRVFGTIASKIPLVSKIGKVFSAVGNLGGRS